MGPCLRLTVIVPAFNEEACLASTLDSVHAAAERLRARSRVDIETIVVNNNSNDGTASVARSRGATVIHEPVQGIARARNTGARHATGDVLVFVDADVIVPRTFLEVVHGTMRDPNCIGGGADVDYRPRRRLVRLYLRAWRLLGKLAGMVQGAAQFCRKSAFQQVGGYDETAWMDEDVDFYWSLQGLARASGRTVRLVREPRVRPSCRRFDKWPLWKLLVWTNPLSIALFRRRKAIWEGLVLGPGTVVGALLDGRNPLGGRPLPCTSTGTVLLSLLSKCKGERPSENAVVEPRAAGGGARVLHGLRDDRQPVHAARHHRVRPAGG